MLVVDPQIIRDYPCDVDIMDMKGLHLSTTSVLLGKKLVIANIGFSFKHKICTPINLGRGCIP